MASGLKETVLELTKKFGSLYEELLKNTTQFEELRRYTKETLDSFKHSLERMQDKLENYERENIKTISELSAEVKSLNRRLDMLSEDALHAAAKDAAVTVMERVIKEENFLKNAIQNQLAIEDKK